jgi:hypothetical protein
LLASKKGSSSLKLLKGANQPAGLVLVRALFACLKSMVYFWDEFLLRNLGYATLFPAC